MIYKYIKIVDPLYKEHFHVFVGDRKKMIKKIGAIMKEEGHNDECIKANDVLFEDDNNAGEHIWIGPNCNAKTTIRAMWFADLNWYVGNYVTVAHECMHATFKLLDSRGVKFDVHNDEPYTYHHTWLMAQVLDVMMRWDHKRIKEHREKEEREAKKRKKKS